MASVTETFQRIDWKLLRKQKKWLLKQRPDEKADGLINLLDALQDAAVEDGIATGKEVFG